MKIVIEEIVNTLSTIRVKVKIEHLVVSKENIKIVLIVKKEFQGNIEMIMKIEIKIELNLKS
jgi:hypothetical protein